MITELERADEVEEQIQTNIDFVEEEEVEEDFKLFVTEISKQMQKYKSKIKSGLKLRVEA